MAAAPARAQIGASVSLQSDYQLHGFSITDRRPVLSSDVAYDHSSGLYLGGSAIAEAVAHEGIEMLGHIEYAGYARRAGGGWSWDLGLSNASLSTYAPGQKRRFHYTELYAGVGREDVSLHLRYSPNYIRPGASALYVDLDGGARLAQTWRLFAHAGLSSLLTRPAGSSSARDHYDLRVGVAHQFSGCELQLAWTTAGPAGGAYPARDRGAVIAGLTYFF
jgi:uncharacterized protein (TIGR02001 family)